MVFTKMLLENALAIRPCNCEAASDPLLPKVARCILVLSSRHIGKCAARVLKRSDETDRERLPFQNYLYFFIRFSKGFFRKYS